MENYYLGAMIYFNFQIHLFYTFILIPYGIMAKFKSEQQVKLFTYFYIKMKKLKISYKIGFE